MDRRDFVRASALGAVGLGLGARWASAQQSEGNVPLRYLHCYTHRLDMERGFKFHCLVPQDTEAGFGRHEYAGFFTVRVGEQPWMFIGDVPPEHNLVPRTLGDLKQGRFSIVRKAPTWAIEQFVLWNAMYPATWLSASVGSGEDVPVTGSLMGWGWAERRTGTSWFAEGEELPRAPGGLLQLPEDCRWFGYHDGTEAFSGILAFTQAPRQAWVDDDGVYWDWGPTVGPEMAEVHPAAYILAPGLLPPERMARLAEMLAKPPIEFTSRAMALPDPAWAVAGVGAEAVPVPPSLRPLHLDRTGALAVRTVAGELLLARGEASWVNLPLPPEIEHPLPKLAAPPEIADEVSQHVTDLLAHRLPDGRFTFSEGRTFYDGITCGVLAQALPILPDDLRRQTTEALRRCLDALCDGHVRSPAYDLLVPPEVPSFIETGIDYPEITATLLYAILAYTLNADGEYAARRSDLIETHLRQIRDMSTPEGLAWARADTQHMHVIAESAIGGYVAWCSLYHLGKLLRKPWADGCRASAALNWAAWRELFRWRDEFGERGVVNGWSNWCAETKRPEPWAYVQSTWFSYVPFMAYEAEDRFGLWRSLREQPWWDYTGTEESSRQRCYDYANMLALAKAGLWEQEVKPHYDAVATRPFWFDYFDATPVMTIAALPQLAAMGLVG